MKIKLTSVMVDDQDKALKFYADILGFQRKRDFPRREFEFLTGVSPEGPDDIEILIESNNNWDVHSKEYQKAVFDDSIPWTVFFVGDIYKEYARIKKLGARMSLRDRWRPG